VVDDDGFVAGVAQLGSGFLAQRRFRVALVDHNEASQSVDGIEEANVEEMIDHHRLGGTAARTCPSSIWTEMVGCTSTIIAELFRRVPPGRRPGKPPDSTCSPQILSDTVILRSPTTTPISIRTWRNGWPESPKSRFPPSAPRCLPGCAVEGMDPRKIIQQDLKVYEESGWKC